MTSGLATPQDPQHNEQCPESPPRDVEQRSLRKSNSVPLRPSATRTEPNVCPRSASSRSAFSMCGDGWFGADIEASLETLRFSEIESLRACRDLREVLKPRRALSQIPLEPPQRRLLVLG